MWEKEEKINFATICNCNEAFIRKKLITVKCETVVGIDIQYSYTREY